ncbi:TenA/THI-4 family protein [Bradyrhizobium arachidis]|uniref:TenA/THI-4 family protein n=1 Tax=Bradyrhizobium arachidis TaxID=858423 RepID=UPI0021626755|nr:TenA/THI-4 family protein [Bradyrhizobium arachidis]UVO30733.1 TenA/THI-4 family protein [Bradyrhizobium arachidis]
MTPPAEPTDLELIRRIASTGGTKYTAGNIDRRKYQRLVALGWLTEVSVNISDVLYEVTEAGKAAARRDG